MEDSPLSLSELNILIQDVIEGNFMDEIWVVAELAEIRKASSGHCYCELIDKDGDQVKARIRGNIWSFQYQRILSNFFKVTGGNLQVGMEVLCLVKVNFHPVFGLSLNIKNIDASYTLGAHEKRRQEILDKLKREGLLGQNSSLDFPLLPKRIAVVTSETAAGYEDFLNQIEQNSGNYSFQLTLFKATMQGGTTANSVQKALQQIRENIRLFDCVVIIRGGGASLDLAGFDDYNLCKSIAEFMIPVVSGIGHERDHTLVDEVVHTKIKTPTAVATFFIQQFENLEAMLMGQVDALKYVVKDRLNTLSNKNQNTLYQFTKSVNLFVNNQEKKLSSLSYSLLGVTKDLLNINKVTIKGFPERIQQGKKHLLQKEEDQLQRFKRQVERIVPDSIKEQHKNLDHLKRSLSLLDPQNVLQRGYAIVYNQEGKIVKSSKTKDSELKIRFKDGNINVKRK